MLVSESVYLHNEDERVLTPIVEMLHHGLEVSEVEELLQRIPQEFIEQKARLESEKYLFLVHNVRGFLKSFHLKIHRDSKLEALQERIERCLQDIR